MIARWAGKASVSQLCRVLDVSRSGFYAAQAEAESSRSPCSESVHAMAVFEASGRTYGSRRMSAALRQQGIDVGRYRARTLMQRNRLHPQWRRKFIHTTDSKHGSPVAANILNRQFRPDRPNQSWVADMTYVQTRSGWLYLAAVLDLYSRKVVGWATSSTMPAQLVCEALQMAIATRQPAPGLLVHSDQGSQYASEEHARLLRRHGLIASMSRPGNCWDNAVMERFFLNLKMERVWQKDYANRREAQVDIADSIVGFYNSSRLHSTLGYRSPVEYERRQQKAAA